MKKMILSALLITFAATAFAGNEGPQAVPKVPTKVLVERTANGGFFVPPGSVSRRQIQILNDGQVIRLEWVRGEKAPVLTPLLQLTDVQTAEVIKLVNAVKPGELVDANPDAPGCQDAPAFYDSVYQGAVRIDIAQTANCKKFVRKEAGSADQQLIQILNSIENKK